MKQYTAVLFCLMGFSAFAAASELKEFEAKGLTRVSVENTSGQVSISATDGAKASVVATKIKFSDQCKMTLNRSDNRLMIKVEKTSGLLSKGECEVDFQVKVPKAVDLDLITGSGNLTIQGIQGDLVFKLGSGDVSANGRFRNIDGKSGSGRIALKGLIGGGELKTGSGDIDLSFATASLKGEFDLKTGSGNATVQFPKGAKVKTSFEAGSGGLSNELGDHPDAPFKLSMKAGSGNLKIGSY
jgi:DUF4097 and DUF4098 domain-containing protein YvlB